MCSRQIPEVTQYRTILTVKGDYLFNLLRSKAGIDGFKEWFPKYIDENAFKSVDIITLNNDMKEKFGFEFYPYLSDWFNRKEQPGFLFSDLQANEQVSLSSSRRRKLLWFGSDTGIGHHRPAVCLDVAPRPDR